MLAIAKVQEEMNSMLEFAESTELSEAERSEIDVYVAELVQEQATKVDSFCQFIKLAQGQADAIEAEGKRLVQKSKAIKNRLDYLRTACANFMQANGLKKVKGNAYSIGLRKTTSVDVYDMTTLREQAPDFVKTKIEFAPDKELIKAELAEGRQVPGAALLEKEHVVIR